MRSSRLYVSRERVGMLMLMAGVGGSWMCLAYRVEDERIDSILKLLI